MSPFPTLEALDRAGFIRDIACVAVCPVCPWYHELHDLKPCGIDECAVTSHLEGHLPFEWLRLLEEADK